MSIEGNKLHGPMRAAPAENWRHNAIPWYDCEDVFDESYIAEVANMNRAKSDGNDPVTKIEDHKEIIDYVC